MQDRFCRSCGTSLQAEAPACPSCGIVLRSLAGRTPTLVGLDAPTISFPSHVMAPDVMAALTAPEGTVYEITEAETYIGRVKANTIAIDNPRLSRQHARIIRSDGQLILEDLHSTNGTLLNGQKLVSPLPLEDGDVITLGGDVALRVSLRHIETRPDLSVQEAPSDRPSGGETVLMQPAARAATPSETCIRLEKVVKRYRSGEAQITILKGISLEINTGEFVVLVGPSGCGKTTTLNMIIGIDRPDAGEVIVTGQPVHRLSENQLARWRGRGIGIVFQFFQLLPTLTVVENVMLPMHFTGAYPKRERREHAMRCLELVNMAERANRLPAALSGGQQQRVAIARALACDPPILVADEPTGNLDSMASQSVFELLTELNGRGKTIVMVTHDPVLARSIPRRVEMLDGEIVG